MWQPPDDEKVGQEHWTPPTDEKVGGTPPGSEPPEDDFSVGKVLDKTGSFVKNALSSPTNALKAAGTVLAAPFEAVGESIRLPVDRFVKPAAEKAAGLPPSKTDYTFRPPTILQETGFAKKTKQPPADPISMATSLYQGVLRGAEQPVINAEQGRSDSPVKAAVQEMERPKDNVSDAALQIGTGLLMGKVGTAPIDATLEAASQVKNFTANTAFKAVERILPGFGEFWQKIPRVAGNILLKDPKLTLNPDNGSVESIERNAMRATDVMKGWVQKQVAGIENRAKEMRVPLVERTEQFGDALATDVKEKGQAIGDLKQKKGAVIPFETQKEYVNHPYNDAIPVYKPEEVVERINTLKENIKSMNPDDALAQIDSLKNSAIKSMANDPDNIKEILYKQIRGLFADVPGETAEKLEAIKYIRAKSASDALTQKFNTPGLNPTLKDISKQQDFIEKYAERMGGPDVFKRAMATRSAINEFEINWNKVKGTSPAETVSTTDKFIADIYTKLNATLDSFPELADSRNADLAFNKAKDAARRLDGAFDNPEKFENFLKQTFENEGSKLSRQRIADLKALEDRVKSSDPKFKDFDLLNDFRRQYQAREQALKASPDFQKEFANPQEAQKTLEGFFRMSPKQEGYAVAKDKLEKLRKVPGMQPIIEDAFKHQAAKTYKEWVGGRGVPFWVTRLAFAIGSDAAMAPFTGKMSQFAIRAGLMTAGDLVGLSPKVTGKVMGLSALASEYASKVLSPSMKARQGLLIGTRFKDQP